MTTVLIVPGLRDHVPLHWQTLLARRLPNARCIEPMGREDLDCRRRVDALEREAQAIDGPIVIVAHSAGCITVAHWAQRTTREVRGALLATPPDFERPMPEGYPGIDALREGGWLPVPRKRLPFSSLVAISANDPLSEPARVGELARAWGSAQLHLGEVGHLNPASGYGEWPAADEWIAWLSAAR
jgi:uncharacterized protein